MGHFISRNHAEMLCFSRITHGSNFTYLRRYIFFFSTQSRREKRPITQSRRPIRGASFRTIFQIMNMKNIVNVKGNVIIRFKICGQLSSSDSIVSFSQINEFFAFTLYELVTKISHNMHEKIFTQNVKFSCPKIVFRHIGGYGVIHTCAAATEWQNKENFALTQGYHSKMSGSQFFFNSSISRFTLRVIASLIKQSLLNTF